jgi:hypothetical protein
MQALLKRLEEPGDPAEALTLETSLVIRRSSSGPRDVSLCRSKSAF